MGFATYWHGQHYSVPGKIITGEGCMGASYSWRVSYLATYLHGQLYRVPGELKNPGVNGEKSMEAFYFLKDFVRACVPKFYFMVSVGSSKLICFVLHVAAAHEEG
jgi:hypothetical protein